MITSPAGRKFIEMWEEGGRPLLTARWDALGKCYEIGFGHTSSAGLPRVRQGMQISPAEADAILGSDLAAVEADVNHHVSVSLTQNAFDALVSFDFNTGGLDRSSLLRAVNTIQPAHMIEQDFLMWDHAHGVFVEGLRNRRLAEWKLFSTPPVA
jgi:lysozyme